MPHILAPHPTTSAIGLGLHDSVPPIPPRTRSRPRSSSVNSSHQKSNYFHLEELPSPDREWQLLENIGDGTYGEVFRAKHIRNPDFYAAVKIMHPTNEVLEEIEQEYRVLFELSSHENLCRFYGAFLKRACSSPPPPRPPPPRNPMGASSTAAEKASLLSVESNSLTSFVNLSTHIDQLWLVMELCTGGSVTDLTKSILKSNQRPEESIIAYILHETCNALHYLHTNNVIHRDVKGHNILITGEGCIKLIDFGVSAFVSPFHGRRNTSVGTPFFMAPEVIACERQTEYDYDARADVWSTGITAIEMAEGEPPLAEMHPMRALVAIPRNPPPTLRQPQQWSNEFNDFIRQCLIKNFESRPTIGQMLKHPFLMGIHSDIIDIRRSIVQIIHRHKRTYDLCVKKTSRETCGVKNGHIRGKSETCSSLALENSHAISSPSRRNPSTMDRPAPPPPPTIEHHKRPAPPPPIPVENLTPSYAPTPVTATTTASTTHKTKRKSQSRRQQKQIQEDQHVIPSSPPKKALHPHFYNSTYDCLSSMVDDLAQLESFDEQSIITCMYHRFMTNQIYTYIGDILVAINPFRPLSIYGKDYMARYRCSTKSEEPPHIYGLADLTYQSMLLNSENQYIVISGESGSGKTQSANFLVQQLTYLGNAPNKRLQEKILQINPLIEGFGNARTMINDNSSRFGKYLEMLFTKQGRVTGARLSEYLLEKTRVVNQGRAERNFHIFYYLFHGLASSKANDPQAFYLMKNQTYRYLKTDLDDQTGLKENFEKKFRAIEKCFEIIGFQREEVTSIYRILAGLLHLGNLNFHQNEGHFIDGKTCLTDRHLLEIICELFGLDINEFELAVTTCNIVTRGETIQRSTTLQESETTRDAMAKALYNRLFSWIVNRISALLSPTTIALQDSQRGWTDDESSVRSTFEYEFNMNNNNNQEDLTDDDYIEEIDRNQTNHSLIASFPPPTVMCAMRRTLEYLDMTPSSSSFLLQIQHSDEDLDDDDMNVYDEPFLNINNNNNNNNSTINPSPPPNSNSSKSGNARSPSFLNPSFFDASSHDERPASNFIDNRAKQHGLPSPSSSPTRVHRVISDTNLALRKKTIENNFKRQNRLLPPIKQNGSMSEDTDYEARRIAILDIFGFENFSSNAFEQLCINITNEQIQYYFNQHVFACEKQEYLNENLSVLPLPATMDLTFYDNRPLLEMFLNKPVGILALIDEESRFPKATDYTLVDKLNANFSSCPLYIRSKASFSSSSISSSSSSTCPSIPSFSIMHFAGQVQYDARGFLEKNRDYLAPEIIQILRASRVQLVSSLFYCSLTKTGTLDSSNTSPRLSPLNASHNRVQGTVSTYFRYSLTDLFSKMVNGSPKFVRCFKPNNERIPDCFNAQTVIEQLKYSGILAAAQIRRFGYSHRIAFADFVQRYSILVYPVTTDLPMTRETCEHILEKLNMQNWTIGKSKVFLKYYHAEELSRLYGNMLKAIITIQSAIRSYLTRIEQRCSDEISIHRFQEESKMPDFPFHQEHNRERAIIIIQSCFRGFLQRRQFGKLYHKPRTQEEAAIIIQKHYRGFHFRKAFTAYRNRLHMQMLCFLQQIELVNNDFYPKLVRTNYCVPMKSIETFTNLPVFPTPTHVPMISKQIQKTFSYLFPPPPPLPLPSPLSEMTTAPKTNEISNSSNTFQLPRSTVHRSPSPLRTSSKFALVRDMFARGGGSATAGSATAGSSSGLMTNPTKHMFTSMSNHSSQGTPAFETSRSPKMNTTVLNAVQEYQRQHINNRQSALAKKFAHLGVTSHRSATTNNLFRAKANNNPIQNKLTPTVLSPKQNNKSAITDQPNSVTSNHPFHVYLRKTGQDLFAGQSIHKRTSTNESKQIDFRSVLKSRQTTNSSTENDVLIRSHSFSQHYISENRLRFNDI